MTNAIIHGFEVDKLTDNVKSVTFLRDDGTLQTLNDDNVTISASFTENGTYLPPSGAIGFDSIEINVPPSGKLETIEVELNDEAQTIRPSVGFDGIGEVRVPKSNLRSLSVQLSPNAKTYTAADDGYFGYSSVSVPGYNNILTNVTLEDLEDADITLGFSQTLTPERIYGQGTTYKGFSSIVLPPAILQRLEVQPSSVERTYRPTDGAYGFSEVTVESVNTGLIEKNITSNGIYKAIDEDKLGYTQVTVDVQPNLEELNITSNGTYTPSTGHDGFGRVIAAVLPPEDTIYITENGNVDVTDYRYALVSVGSEIQSLPDITFTNVGTDVYAVSRGVATEGAQLLFYNANENSPTVRSIKSFGVYSGQYRCDVKNPFGVKFMGQNASTNPQEILRIPSGVTTSDAFWTTWSISNSLVDPTMYYRMALESSDIRVLGVTNNRLCHTEPHYSSSSYNLDDILLGLQTCRRSGANAIQQFFLQITDNSAGGHTITTTSIQDSGDCIVDYLELPANIDNLQANSLDTIRILRLQSIIPPTISSSFSNSIRRVYVPSEAYNDYMESSDWTSWAFDVDATIMSYDGFGPNSTMPNF